MIVQACLNNVYQISPVLPTPDVKTKQFQSISEVKKFQLSLISLYYLISLPNSVICTPLQHKAKFKCGRAVVRRSLMLVINLIFCALSAEERFIAIEHEHGKILYKIIAL